MTEKGDVDCITKLKNEERGKIAFPLKNTIS